MDVRSALPSTTNGNAAKDSVVEFTFAVVAWSSILFTCASQDLQEVQLQRQAAMAPRRTEAREPQHLPMVTKLIRRIIQPLVKVLVRQLGMCRRRSTSCT